MIHDDPGGQAAGRTLTPVAVARRHGPIGARRTTGPSLNSPARTACPIHHPDGILTLASSHRHPPPSIIPLASSHRDSRHRVRHPGAAATAAPTSPFRRGRRCRQGPARDPEGEAAWGDPLRMMGPSAESPGAGTVIDALRSLLRRPARASRKDGEGRGAHDAVGAPSGQGDGERNRRGCRQDPRGRAHDAPPME